MKHIAPQIELPLGEKDDVWYNHSAVSSMESGRLRATYLNDQPRYIISRYTIYTDGSAWPNPGGPAGWCAIVMLNGQRVGKPVLGRETQSTNNRAEINAAIAGLRKTPKGASVTVITDSQYLQNGANKWCHCWVKNDFRKAKNADLWRKLWVLIQERDCVFQWVRGHNGDALNEEADRLAEKERLAVKL